jgi:hypothetical protein
MCRFDTTARDSSRRPHSILKCRSSGRLLFADGYADTILFLLLCCGALAACSRSDDSTSSRGLGEGRETDGYVYYADHASVRKADETVTMSDLFDYKKAQVDGGPSPLSKRTEREYDCQSQKSQSLKSSWSFLNARLEYPSNNLTTIGHLLVSYPLPSLPPLRLQTAAQN